MESKKKVKLITASVIVSIMIICAVVLILYNLRIIGKTGMLTTNSDGTQIDAASLPEVTLTFGIPGFKTSNADEILKELEKRAIKDLNVKLNFKWNDMTHANVENYIKGWNDSDVDYDAYCLADFADIAVDLRKAMKDGLIMDINELFPKYAPKYYKKFPPEELERSTYEGKLCIIPSYSPNSGRRFAVVRDDLMKKYNIQEINSYDSFEEYLSKIKQNESGIIPLFLSIANDPRATYAYDTALKLFAETYGYVIVDYGLGIVYKWDDPEMKLAAWEQTPEYRDAIGKLIKWRSSGFCDKDGKYFDMSKYASVIASKAELLEMTRNSSVGSNFDSKFRVVDLYPDKVSQRYVGIRTGLAVSSKSKHPERVLMFIEWLQSNQENYDLLMYGIKGKNYVLYGEQMGFPKDGDTNDLSYINWSGHYSFMNLDNERTNVMLPPDFKKVYINDIQKKSKIPPDAGCVPDFEPVKDIAGKRVFSFCTVEEAIRTGSYNDKTIDNFISDQKQKEVDKLISTLQKQFDDWRAANKNGK